MAIADTIDKISQLLWEQKLDEARELLRTAHGDAQSRIMQLEMGLLEARQEMTRIEALMPPDMKPARGFIPKRNKIPGLGITATAGLGAYENQISDLAKTLPKTNFDLVLSKALTNSWTDQHKSIVDASANVPTSGLLSEYFLNTDGAFDKLTAAQREDRRKNVIDCAKWLAKEIGSTVEVGQIASQLAVHQIEMGVPPNRVATTISTILTRTEEFESIGTGLYKRVKISEQEN